MYQSWQWSLCFLLVWKVLIINFEIFLLSITLWADLLNACLSVHKQYHFCYPLVFIFSDRKFAVYIFFNVFSLLFSLFRKPSYLSGCCTVFLFNTDFSNLTLMCRGVCVLNLMILFVGGGLQASWFCGSLMLGNIWLLFLQIFLLLHYLSLLLFHLQYSYLILLHSILNAPSFLPLCFSLYEFYLPVFKFTNSFFCCV